MSNEAVVIKVFGLVLLSVTMLVLIVWLILPGKKEKYENYGKIPLKKDPEEK